MVPCCINSSKYIEDTAQLSIITNWLCHIFCYSATLIHTLSIVLLLYILFLYIIEYIANMNSFYAYRGPKCIWKHCYTVRACQENTARKSKESWSCQAKLNYNPLTCSSPTIFPLTAFASNTLPSQIPAFLQSGNSAKTKRSIVKGLPRLESWCTWWECLTQKHNSWAVTQCAVSHSYPQAKASPSCLP